MWKDLLKIGVQVGGNILLPGAGSLGAGILDATLPSDEPTEQPTVIDPTVQSKGDVDYGALASVGLGMAGGLMGDLLSPKAQVMSKSFNRNQQWARGG